ncbi:MAG TPA: S49 family peptidase [Candidatus Paceibacterota bacterium]|nr:S49 family peptidase [Candidatus Paceibacterota bacterium]
MTKQTAITLIIVTGIVAFIVGAITSIENEEYTDAGLPLSCNVLVVPVNGYLSTYSTEEDETASSDDVLHAIQIAQSEEQIKALILLIDSYGGDGVAGEEIANALKAFDKPSAAAIRGIGASSAYWGATGADRIFASRISDVGGIGITASYLDESIKNTRDGYKYIELNSAIYKDLGDPYRPLTNEEKTIIEADLKKIHEIFVDDVSANRNLERDTVARLANGLTYVGIDALEYGLIDEIGDLTTATKYIESTISEGMNSCWY